MKKLRAFTLIELMITIAVGGILVSLAVPSFQNIIRENRLATQANELIGSLNLARSEAIRRGINVTVTPNAGGWNSGWVIATTNPADNSAVTVRIFEALNSSLSFTGGAGAYTFLPSGFKSDLATPVHTLCDTTTSGKRGRQISVSASGRPRINTVEYTC